MAVAVGTAIKLGGRSWTTQQAGDGSLILSISTADDDGRQRVDERMDGVAHEVRQRKTEMEALAAQQAHLMAAMHEVSFVADCYRMWLSVLAIMPPACGATTCLWPQCRPRT